MASSGYTGDMQVGFPKEILPKGSGDKYLCNFCNLVLRDPVQSSCGHRFCKACMETNLSSGKQIKCTQCEKEDNEEMSIINRDEIYPDNAIKREMMKLDVVCANIGCGWQGKFRQFEEHFGFCQYKEIICPDCKASVRQNLYSKHKSTECLVQCPQQCGEMVYSQNLEDHIRKQCRLTQVICDQCGRALLKEQIEQHKKECQTEQIACPVGCGMIPRKNYHTHFREKKHDVWMAQEMDKVLKLLHSLPNVGNIEERQQELGRSVTSMADKVASLELLVQDSLSRQVDTAATASPGVGNLDTKIRQSVELQTQSMTERLDVKIGTFEGIASALHRELEKVISALEKLEGHRLEMRTKLDEHAHKIQQLERTIAVKDVSMAELEHRALSMESACYDGTFIWKVSDFTKKHQEALNGKSISIYSPPFYTSRRGYKMCARLYPNGDGMGKGSHLSLFFVVMRGYYDALLKWPFSQRVTFCMINQIGGEHVIDSFRPDPQSSSFKRPSSDMNIASGCPLFIRLEMLQNPNNGFIKDDTLFLKISVDTKEISDPISSFDERIKPSA